MRKYFRLMLGLVVSLFFLWFIFRQINDIGLALQAAQQANYWFVLPALIVYFVGVWIRAVRWRFLLAPVKLIGIGELFRVVVIGYMANDVLPIRMGELVRAHVLGEQENVSKTATFATIVVERIFDGIVMLLFVGVVLLLHLVPASPELESIFRIAGILVVGALLAFLAVALSPGVVNRVLDLVLSGLPINVAARAEPNLRRFLTGLGVLQSPIGMAATLLLSILAWLCEAGMYFILALGFPGINLPYHAMVLNTAVANLATMIPSSPGYVGTFDAASVFTLGLYGVDPAVAFSYTVALHLALVVPVTLWGAWYWWRYHLSLREIQQPVTGDATPEGGQL